MDHVSRIGVSLEPDLLKAFDVSISKKGYVSRSEALRDLVRDSLAESEWKNDEAQMAGALVFIFDTRVTDVLLKVESSYRRHRNIVMYSSSLDLDDFLKMEIVVAEGKLSELKEFSADMTAIKGVLRGKLTMVAPKTGNMHHIGMRD